MNLMQDAKKMWAWIPHTPPGHPLPPQLPILLPCRCLCPLTFSISLEIISAGWLWNHRFRTNCSIFLLHVLPKLHRSLIKMASDEPADSTGIIKWIQCQSTLTSAMPIFWNTLTQALEVALGQILAQASVVCGRRECTQTLKWASVDQSPFTGLQQANARVLTSFLHLFPSLFWNVPLTGDLKIYTMINKRDWVLHLSHLSHNHCVRGANSNRAIFHFHWH